MRGLAEESLGARTDASSLVIRVGVQKTQGLLSIHPLVAEARSWGSFYQVLECWGLVAGLRDSSAGVRLLSGDKERQGRDSSYHS